MTEVAGALTERVELSGPVLTPDDAGGHTSDYLPLDPPIAYAAIESLRGAERMQAAAAEVVLAYRARLRYHSGIGAGTRIAWAGRVLEVVGPPVELERRAVIEVYLVERGGA